MPSEKTKSKEDTWTPQELEKSLKEIRGDKRRSRDRDDGQDGDKERRRRHHDDVDGHKERRRKDEGGKKLDKEIDDIKRDERRMKDEDREERHRKKREERKNREATTEDKDDRSKRRSENGDSRDEQDRHKRDANNHNGRDDDKRRREKDRSRNREHKDDREKRHRSRDGRPERVSEKADRRSEKNGEERMRSHKDDEDRRRKPRDEEEKKRSHRGEDEKRSHKDGDDRRRSHRDDSGRRRSHREDDERRKHKNDDEKRRSHRDDDDDRKRSNRDDDRKRSNRDDDDRKRSNRDDDDKRTKHRDDDDKRRRSRNEDERRRSRKDEERKESGKVCQEEDSRERRSSDKDKRHRRSEDKKEGKKDRLKEEERYVGAKHKTDQSDVEEEDPPKQENAGEDYEDDFEDYEEDFEDDADETDDDKELGQLGVTSPGRVFNLRKDWDVSKAPANEVDAVLKALDAENERLMVESRRSNNSDSTDLSDDRFRPSHSANQQRVFVNFVSAKQMVLSDKASSKARTRGRDLLQLIDLDVSSYEMFDLPPIKEYDLYIRNYGRTDTNQVYVQTNEDNIDRDIQTEDIEYDDKWSQHPSDDTVACGRGDGNKERRDEEEFNTGPHLHSEDLTKLTKFIEKAGQAISILLEEETESEKSNPTTQSNISVSQGYSQLTTPSFLQGHSLRQNVFSTRQPNLLLSLYSSSIEKGDHNPITGGLGCICVWNISEPSFPQRTLVCDSIPTCCCFSPSNTSLIFAGMADGSLVLWDTREPASLHHSVTVEGRELCLRHPTYNTAGVLSTDNHQSSVVKITPTLPPVVSSNSSTSVAEVSSGASYQIISIDESGCMNLWVVAEISSSDIAGSESDLGLSPGGKVKLLRSSSFTLDNPVKDARLKSNLKITYLQLNPKDSNLFLAGTDAGFIVHGARYGSKPIPRVYLGVSDSPVPVTCIDFSPFCNPCFLAGCADGNVRLYHSHSSKPLISWTSSEEGVSVVSVQWSTNRPGVFYVLYSNSNLAVYDLVEMDTKPTALDHITGSGRVIDMALSPDAYCRGQGEPQKHPHLVLTMDTGQSEIHAISKTMVEPQPFEEDFLNSYLDRF